MLVMMSFNAILFGATIVMLSVCEFVVGRWRGGGGGHDYDANKPPEAIGVADPMEFPTYEMVGNLD